MPGIGSLVAWLGALAARFLGVGVLRWLATKAAVLFVCFVAVPVLVNNLIYSILAKVLSMHTGQVGTVPSATLTFVGIGAWMAIQLKIPESMSLVMGAVAKRVGVALIPFLGKK